MMSKTRATPRKHDAFGQPLLKVGDIVRSIPKHLDSDPGTVVRILQVNANGAHVVAVRWFTWDNGRTSEEHVRELELVSKA